MKKFLAIIAMMVTMLCGSMILVSCSNNYKNMQLVVEYALPGENDEVEWHEVDLGKGLSYTISDTLQTLNMRVRVEGTSKKVDSLYISQSVNSATFLQNTSVAPNEVFKVAVKNTGSVRFTITPSQGGAGKATSFNVNIYKQIEEISQNVNCVPAMVAGGYVDLSALTDLIRYEPYGKTNQTGVNFTISGVGTLIKNDNNPDDLLGRDFCWSSEYVETPAKYLSKNVISEFKKGHSRVALEMVDNKLMLTTDNYTITYENNVIELTASSIWNDKLNKTEDDKIECKVYVYLVENIRDALLVSYNDNKEEVYENNGDKLTADNAIRKEVDDTVVLYNSTADSTVVDRDYNSVNLYTYMNPSIYSYESKPGLKLNVYFNGEKYNYGAMPDNRFGIQVNPITDSNDKLVGLKFAVNPNSISSVTKYNTKIEVEFDAFDFSASDKNPEVYLTKEFVIDIRTLVSGFNINKKSYQNNLGQLDPNASNAPYITELDSNEVAKLFTSYEGDKGMPISIQSTPTGAMNETVYMGIYSGYDVANGKPGDGDENYVGNIQLVDRYNFSVSTVDMSDGYGQQFKITKDLQRSQMYLRFNPTLANSLIPNLENLYMVCRAVCTPSVFGFDTDITPKYITFVSKIKLVGAVDDVDILNEDYKEFDENINIIEYKKRNTIFLNLTTTKLHDIDFSQVSITSENKNVEFYVDSQWVKETTADKLADKIRTGITYKELKYRTTTQCEDAINVISANGKGASVQLKFVSVVTSVANVDVRYDDPDIWTYKEGGVTKVTELDYKKDGNTTEDLQLSYLAIQSGGTAQFMVCGDGSSVNIQSISVKSLIDNSKEYLSIYEKGAGLYYEKNNISSFNSSAVRITSIGGNLFDVNANSDGYTSIVFVKADFYALENDKIELKSKYFVFEIATYTPARDIRVSEVTGKDSIIYINENYLDVAQLKLSVKLNGATQEINFSNTEVNNVIKVDYGDNDNKSIYGIKVDYSDLSGHENMFKVDGLNEYEDSKYISLANKTMTVTALKKLEGFNSGIITFKVVQFGEEKEVTEIKYVVVSGSYNPTDTIVIESGVQLFNNVYLSLLGEDNKSVDIVAYATNANGDATYTDLGYAVKKLIGDEYKDYTGSNLRVVYNEESNLFTVSANSQGGVYKITIYPKDSVDGVNSNASKEIKVTVSDGKTEATAYLINNLTEFMKITDDSNNTYYRLSSDIDFDINHLSTDAEKDALTAWWGSERQFKGHLNGQMVIENLGTNAKITRNYALKNVTVDKSKAVGNDDNFGLFTNVLGNASIKNVIFENAMIGIADVEVDGNMVKAITKTTANIGIITAVNNGTIENCSIMLGSSIVKVSNLDTETINLGLVAGQNKAKITYNSSNNTSNYSYIVDCASGAALSIEAEIKAAGEINVGGIAGINTREISADYDESKDVSVRELINAVVNINAKITRGKLNLGGLAGQNAGTIKKITVTGALVATGNKDNVDCKVNVGGVAGQNAGIITEVVNLGADITGNKGVQNVGGIIGYNTAAIVDNVRVMFIAFDSSEVKVGYSTAIIQGQGNVGGIIGETTDTQLTRAFVENFIVDEINIEGTASATVAGLVASGSADATLCFVQANVAAGEDNFNAGEYNNAFGSSVTPKYSYFVGSVDTVDANGEVTDSVDTVEYYEDEENNTPMNIVAEDKELAYETDVEMAGFYINWKRDDNINSGYPYLVYKIDDSADYTYTLTKAPQEIIVNVDNQYFDIDDRFVSLTAKPTDWATSWVNYYKKDDAGRYVKLTGEDDLGLDANKYYTATRFEAVDGQGLYMQYEIGDNIVASAVVYYDANMGDNIYKLVSDGNGDKGLIEQTIVPSIADGDYSVSVVEGGSFATLSGDNKTIKFTGTGRVVLRFVSMYDRSVTDTVVIYVEKPLDDDVFDITTSAGLKLTTEGGTDYSTRVNTESMLGIKLKGDAGNTFDSTKLYMTAKVVSNEDYLTVTGTTANVGETLTELDKYLLGQFEVSADELPNNISSTQIEVELSVYLDLSKYEGKDGKQVSIHMDKYDALLETRTITITIYNKATNLTVPSNSNIKAETSIAIDISANLETGYINDCGCNVIDKYNKNNNQTEYYLIMGDELQRIWLYTPDHDTIEYSLSAINDNAKKLVAKQKDLNPEFSIWDLFDIIITHEETSNGYKYNLNLRLKEEFKYLDLKDQTDNEWRFKVLISANGGELEKPVEFAYVPQRLNSLRIENYSNLAVKTPSTGGTVAEFVSNNTESSLIIPGESGLIKIFAEYNYSYFENIKINSTTQVIDGKTYFVKFQQMVYNRTTKAYQSLAGVTADGSSLTLRKVTYTDNGNNLDDEYDGTIFVRTILEKFAGERKAFTITVEAETYDINMNKLNVSRDKTVISQYRPGIYVSVSNALEDVYTVTSGGTTKHQAIYLVEQGTQVSMIEAVVQGYEYNVQPTYQILKLKQNGDWDKEGDWESVNNGSISLIKQFNTETTDSGAATIKYLLKLNANEKQPFKIVLKVRLIDNGNELTEESETLLFCPVPFVPKSVSLSGITNNDLVVPVNTSKSIQLLWNTMSPTLSQVTEAMINDAISSVDFLDLFYINSVEGKQYFRDFIKTETEEDAEKSFVISGKNNNYAIESNKNENPIRVHFNLWYEYEFEKGDNNFLENVTVRFSSTPKTHLMSYSFDLCLTLHTTEDAPTPIYDVGDLIALGDGANGILMNDIVINLDDNSDIDSEGKVISLGPWRPITSEIASLDGNGKIISFTGDVLNVEVRAVTEGNKINTGLLFETVSENTILKNIAINIGGLGDSNSHVLNIKDDNVPETSVNFGLLAGQNDGLIYNCEIISKTTKTLELVVGDRYDLTFGGLVGVNNGNITNSRVGTEYFERITAIGGGYMSSRENCYPINLRSSGIMGGLVGENNGGAVISSCFVANTTIENYSNIGNTSSTRTAGFVATNDGTIAYSYVKGVENTILETHLRTTKGMVYASGAGSVAGFAYYNSGTIHDCYSNIDCISLSSAVAGFVYDTSNGAVYQCYSASKVDSLKESSLATELPFIGVGIDENNAQQLLSSENVSSCYYLNSNVEYDNNYLIDSKDVKPKGLSEIGFSNTNNLNNFSFVEFGTPEQKLNAVWTTSTAIDKNRSTYALGTTVLPELTSANQIARSVRTLVSGIGEGENKTINEYKYVTDYEKGSKNNPYVIRSAEEYEDVFVNGEKVVGTDTDGDGSDDKKYIVANVRFIDNINFGKSVGESTQYIDIGTRDNYILGSSNRTSNNNPVLTVVDGNGMTISNIAINYAQNESNSKLGLFGEAEYSIIKGLTLQYADNGGSTTAIYVGGVAGTAHDTYMIDLTLENSVELRGRNVVGGVVGKLTGDHSGLFNINSNLSAVSGYNGQFSYKENVGQSAIDDSYISYAGGIAGIIDSYGSEIHIEKLTINGANIKAQRSGGIAGYVGKNIKAKRLTYYISISSRICGSKVVGGLIAENYADIQLSQVNSQNNDTQYEYDKHFGEYINSVDMVVTDDNGTETVIYEAIDKTDTEYGNLSAVVGGEVIGGFIGKNFGGDINDSLTKANISHETNIDVTDQEYTYYDWGANTTIGGFIGEAYGGNITNVYAQNYIELNYVEDNKTVYAGIVGGLIGKALKQSATQNKFGMDNVVALNFFDKTQVEKVSTILTDKGDPIKDSDGNTIFVSNQNVGYIVGVVDEDVVNCLNTKTSVHDNSAVATYGVFNANQDDPDAYKDNKITKGQVSSAQSINMQNLYKDGSSEQQDIFNILFASWDSTVWEKIYTRYTPNLKLDSSDDYYVIDSPEDVKQMEYDPEGNFILTEDVDVIAGNYVVFNNFKGSLFGVKKLDNPNNSTSFRYTRFNISLSPNAADYDGAGFFKQTEGARIGNIGFQYSQVVLNTSDADKSEYKLFGGVSATDYNSRFEQIAVTKFNDYLDGCIKTYETQNVTSLQTIGSIIGEGYSSEILSCTSDLTYNLNVKGAYVGGLVGRIGKYESTEEEDNYIDGLISGSSYSGGITLYGGAASIGGIVADTDYTRVSSSTVENGEGPVSITLKDIGNCYIGGIVAYNANSTIGDCYANVNVSISDEDDTNETHIIGGIVAKAVSGVGDEATVNNSSAKLTTETSVNTAFIGGIVGSAGDNEIKLTGVASVLNVKNIEGKSDDILKVGGIVAENTAKPLTIVDAVSIMYATPNYSKTLIGGGIIGHTANKYSLTYVASMGYIHANSTASKNSTTSTITALGGLIGAVVNEQNSNDATEYGPVVNEQNSNDATEYVPVDGEIANSYAALTLSAAGVFRGDVGEIPHDVYTGGIAGYVKLNSDVKLTDVVYSSDYTLALEEHNNFAKAQNVTANVLTTDITATAEETNIMFIHTDSWTRGGKNANEKYGLPMPPNTANLLQRLDIWTMGESDDSGDTKTVYSYIDDAGKPYYPIIVDKDTDFNADYKYYQLSVNSLSDDGGFTKKESDLHGVLLGNNITIVNAEKLFRYIRKHSAVANINFELKDDFSGNASVATKNEGTIFMVGVNYQDITVSALIGIVAINNGVVSNCYNHGVAKASDDATAGLVGINNVNAVITDCYFTGVFNKVEGAEDIDSVTLIGSGIACENKGYIGNTYTGGQSQYVIEKISEGRHDKVFYDFYATFVYKNSANPILPLSLGDYGTLNGAGIEGLATIGIQEVQVTGDVKSSSSTLFVVDDDVVEDESNLVNNWRVYSMYNWDDIYNKVLEEDPEVKTTYNYGYPIKIINQKCYNGQIVDVPAIRGKMTGNGTFNQVGAEVLGNTVVHKDDEGEIARFDSNPFLISNLGVLSLINEIDGGNEQSGTKGKYFALENNITMFNPKDAVLLYQGEEDNGLLTGGPQIGKNDNPFEGIFTSAPSANDFDDDGVVKFDDYFAKSIDENKNVTYTYTNKSLTTIGNPKIISNMNGNALFNTVGDGAIIANIQLTGTKTKDAPLISNVGYTEGSKSSTAIVYKVRIGRVISSNDRGDKAGFVHTVGKDATLKLEEISSNIIFETNEATSITAGVVAKNQGTIDATNITKLNVKITKAIKNIAGFVGTNEGEEINTGSLELVIENMDKTIDSVSGFVNTMTSGKITARDITVDISKVEIKTLAGFVNEMTSGEITAGDVTVGISEVEIETLAGLVGSMTGRDIKGSVKFVTGTNVVASTFGGAVAKLEGGTVNCEKLTAEGDGITVLTDNVFGGLVAIAKGGKIIGTIASTITINANNLNNSKDSAYGFVIGKYEDKTTIEYRVDGSIAFKAIDGTNVGGIVGLAKYSEFEFVNGDAPTSITVAGANNVGGFIGKYQALDELSFTENSEKWPIISANEYAKIGIATNSDNDKQIYSNFGGLIGSYESEEVISEELQNKNTVLNDKNTLLMTSSSGKEFKIGYKGNASVKKEKDYIINNVGGVIGQLVVNDSNNVELTGLTNTADIGIQPENSAPLSTNGNPIQGATSGGSLYSMYQFNNVGGIFGYVSFKKHQLTYDELGGYIFDGDSSCDNKSKLILTNASNTGNISGMTAVGGIVGFAKTNIHLNIDGTADSEPDSTTTPTPYNIQGVFDVGGLVGYAEQILYITGNSSEDKSKPYIVENININGLVNVGGLVGGVKDLHVNYAQIGEATPMEIKGNLYVGGVAGYIEIATLSNITITSAVKIYGTVFAYDFRGRDGINSFEETYTAHYLPTYIGGVAGYIKQTHLEVDTIINSGTYKSNSTSIKDVKTSAKVATDEQFKITENNYVQVNMNTNYYANSTNNKKVDEEKGRDLSDYFSNILVRYDQINGGIGGFIGSIDANDLNLGSDVEYSKVCMAVGIGDGNVVSGGVYAPYGINVGGVFGNVDGNFGYLNLPTMSDASVVGKVFIGAFVGKCDLAVKYGEQDINGNRIIEDISIPETEVNVQRYKEETMPGYCVGGVIGYVSGDVHNIKLTNPEKCKIKVFNSGSTHVGALVGRLDGTMTGCLVAPELCGASKTTVESESKFVQYYAPYMLEKSKDVEGKDANSSIIQTPKEYNYGGLVGLLNVWEKSSKVSVTGDHYYAFTIDIVQNYNMSNGETKYSYENIDSDKILAAMAHYVNEAGIDVSISGLNDLYDGFYTCSGDNYVTNDMIIGFDHNPTRKDALGWASEYTMFRAMTRAIDQTSSSSKIKRDTGDSVQVIYSADYVEEVGVSEYRQYDVVNEDGLSFRCETEVVYTIYQPLGQPAKLYCKQGIASEGEYTKEDVFNVTLKDEEDEYITIKIKPNHGESSDKIINGENLHQHIDYDFNLKDAEKNVLSFKDQEFVFFRFNLAFGFYSARKVNESFDNPNYTIKLSDLGLVVKDDDGDDDDDDDDIEYLSTVHSNKNIKYISESYTTNYDYVKTKTLFKKCFDKAGGNLYTDAMDRSFIFKTVFRSGTSEESLKIVSKLSFKYGASKEGQDNALGFLNVELDLDSCCVINESTIQKSYSESGSIFEVTGQKVENEDDLIIDATGKVADQGKNWFEKLLTYAWEGIKGGFIYGGGSLLGALTGAIVGSVVSFFDPWGIGHVQYPTASITGGVANSATVDYMTNNKLASLRTVNYMFDHIYSNDDKSSHGALQTVYSRNISEYNGNFASSNDDMLVFNVTGTANNGSTNKLDLSYLACGPAYTVPPDINAMIEVTYDGKSYMVPKYQQKNGELYMYPNSGNYKKKLEGFYDIVLEMLQDRAVDTENKDCIISNSLVYLSELKAIQSGGTFINGVVSGDAATYVQSEYGVEVTIDKQINYILEPGVGDGTTSSYNVDVYWKQTDEEFGDLVDGKKEVTFTHYTDTKPSGLYVTRTITINGEEKEVYLTTAGSDENKLSENVEVVFSCVDGYGNLYDSGMQEVGKSYHIKEDNSGKITKTITYYLYYPNIPNEEEMDNITDKLGGDPSSRFVLAYGIVATTTSGGSSKSVIINHDLPEGSDLKGTTLIMSGITYTLPEGEYKRENGKLLVKKTVSDYGVDTHAGFDFIYQKILTTSTNNNILSNYNKYVYITEDNKTLYTRYYYGNDFFDVKIKDGENSKFIYEILTKSNLIFSESVRVTLDNGKFTTNLPSYVTS